MQFIQGADDTEGLQALAQRLNQELAGGRQVLWLITGGSNITISVAVMASIDPKHTKNLVIMLADERYGEVNHTDSNAKQLHDADFQPHQAVFIPPLVSGLSLEETRQRYAQASQRAFEDADIIIGQIGIGPDGHIAGILPHSPAVTSNQWVAAYQGVDFVRFTLTFQALRHIKVNYTFAFGADKRPALETLRDTVLPLSQQPAQFLKQLPEAYIYNDQLGGEA